MVKNPPANGGDMGWIPGLGRGFGGGYGNHFNIPPGEHMDRGAWWHMVHGISKGQTKLSE